MRLFILFFALLFPIITSGQSSLNEAIAAPGEKLRNSPRKSLPHVLSYDASGGMYAIQSSLKRTYGFARRNPLVHTLQYYDSLLHIKKTMRLDLKHQGIPLKYQFMVELNQNLYLFSSYYNEDTNKECLLARMIDPLSLIPGKAVMVAEVNNPNKDGFFRHELSEQGKSMLIAYTKWDKGKAEKSIDLYVLGEQLKMLWHKEHYLPKKGMSFNVEQYRLDNEGNVFLLSTLFPDQRAEKRLGAATYEYFLHVFRNHGQEVEDYGIKLKDKFITDLQIRLNGKREIIGGGFYAEEGSYKVKGSYFFTIDPDAKEVVNKSVKEFDENFLRQDPSFANLAHEHANQQLRQYGFSLNDILVREDGSAVLLGEQYFVSSSTTFNRRSKKAKSKFFYEFQDIVVINVNADGEIEWVEKVEKQQRTSDDAGLYSSYIPIMVDDNLYFLYNVFPSKIQLAKMNRTGEVLHLKGPKLPESGMVLIPKTADQRPPAGLVMLMGGDKFNCFVKIRINGPGILSKL